MSTAPDAPYDWGVSRHWTAGCSGTTAFLAWVFRAVGIPVTNAQVGWHNAPRFVAENLYLSHGDDPYDALSKTNYPATMLLIDQAKFNAWFPANNRDAADLNVGRRAAELAVQYPGSQWIMERFCDDQQAGKSHATGKVYNETFKRFFTVQELENANLWQRLDQIAATQGCSM